MQQRTSKNTSIRTVNRIYKKLVEDLLPKGSTIIDIGCGKYNDMKDFAEENGYEWYGFDPFNRTDEENKRTQDRFNMEYPDVVICNNVLNVIDDDKALDDLINNIACESNEVKHFFTIYEGDGSGVGKESKPDCWQRNEKTNNYIPRLEKHFKQVAKVKGESNILVCTN